MNFGDYLNSQNYGQSDGESPGELIGQQIGDDPEACG
jgi:hypothetical protein